MYRYSRYIINVWGYLYLRTYSTFFICLSHKIKCLKYFSCFLFILFLAKTTQNNEILMCWGIRVFSPLQFTILHFRRKRKLPRAIVMNKRLWLWWRGSWKNFAIFSSQVCCVGSNLESNFQCKRWCMEAFVRS
jgi:hypothetical protein